MCVCAEVVIGFERTMVTTSENAGTAELCAVIRMGSLERSVDITFSTQPGTAQGRPFLCTSVAWLLSTHMISHMDMRSVATFDDDLFFLEMWWCMYMHSAHM